MNAMRTTYNFTISLFLDQDDKPLKRVQEYLKERLHPDIYARLDIVHMGNGLVYVRAWNASRILRDSVFMYCEELAPKPRAFYATVSNGGHTMTIG